MKTRIILAAFAVMLSCVAVRAQDKPESVNTPPIGFDRYPKREYPFLFNNILYNLLLKPATVTEFITVPIGTIPAATTLESGYSAIERLSNYPVNLLYDKIGVGWTSLILFVKEAALDFPFAYFMTTLNHEYSGHASRFYEAGQYVGNITFGVPFPWGPGGAATSGTVPQSIDENIFIATAGSEANTVMAHEMDLRFVSTGVVYPFDVLLYLNAKLDELLYIDRSTGHPSGLRMVTNGDYEEYLILINNKYGRVLPHTYRLKLDELKRWSYTALADPFLYLSASAFFYNLVTGRRYMSTFMIPIAGGLTFMPSARVAYTPNGPECYGDLFFKLPERTDALHLYVRIGSTSLRQTWGMGVRAYRMAIGRFVELGGGLDLFNQPRVMNHMSTYFIETVYWNLYPDYISLKPADFLGQLTAIDLEYGYLARGIKRIFGAAVYADLTFKANEFFRAYLRIGYKSNGYVFGLSLKKGLFWHAGLGFNF